MKNKKGFTLTELIGVLVILSIIILAATLTYIGIRDSILEKQYQNLVRYIEVQAAKYAEETGITSINVEDLIKEGYIDPDDETDIYDPRDKSSMNCYVITMRYEQGGYTAKLGEEKRKGNSCGYYEQTSDYKIVIKGYVEESTEKCNKYEIEGKEEWYNCDVELGVETINNEEVASEAKIEWYGNSINGETSRTIKTKTYELSKGYYRVKVTTNETIGGATKVINIDKQKPLIEVKIENENIWTAKDKQVSIEATDYEGSGIEKYYIGKNADCKTSPIATTKEVELGNGRYYVCVIDKVENISEEKEIEITKVDSKPIMKDIKSNDEITSGGVHTGEKDPFTLEFNGGYPEEIEEGVDASTIHYEYQIGENGQRNRLNGNTVNVGMDAGVVTYKAWACNETQCSDVMEYEVVTQITVTFETNGGSQVNDIKEFYNQNYGNLRITTRSGYNFNNWYLENSYNTLIQSNTKVTTINNHTLYAKWLPITYTITYNLNSGTNNSSNPSSYTIETNTINLQNPTRNGYTFNGWYTTSSFSGSATTSIPKGSMGNKTFYAKWTKNPSCSEGTLTYNSSYGGNICVKNANTSSGVGICNTCTCTQGGSVSYYWQAGTGPHTTSVPKCASAPTCKDAGAGSVISWDINNNIMMPGGHAVEKTYTSGRNGGYNCQVYADNLAGGYVVDCFPQYTGNWNNFTCKVNKTTYSCPSGWKTYSTTQCYKAAQ